MITLLYPLLTAALFYLGSRAKITQPLWSRYPPALASFMDCAACTGFWYGFFAECVLGRFRILFNFTVETPLPELFSAVLVGLCSIVWTPVVAALMQHSLYTLGSAVDTDVSPSGESPADE